MKEILCQAWQLVHSWATTRPVLFVMMNLMIGGILATSARLRDKTITAEGGTANRQASLFTKVMSRTFSVRNSNYDWALREESMASADSDRREAEYEDEIDEDEEENDEGVVAEIQEEVQQKSKYPPRNDKPSLSRRTRGQSSRVPPPGEGSSGEADSDRREAQYEDEGEEEKDEGVVAEIQEEVQQKSKYPPRNDKPSLSRRTRGQSSRVPPLGEGSSGEMVAVSASSGEITDGAAPSSSSKKVRVSAAPPAPGGLMRSGSFLSSLVSFGRSSDRNITPSTGLEGAPGDKKKGGVIHSEAYTTEVDTEAENFIRKFRKQLKLQRLQSMLQRQENRDK